MLRILRFLIVWAAIVPVGSVWASDDLTALRQRWAELKYHHANDRDRVAQAESLEREAAALAAQDQVAPALLLQADTLALTAEFMHSGASLTRIREARDLLLRALQEQPENPQVLSALGSIYYEVPGWPIAFGDKKKAEQYLTRALAIDPHGRDTNYFMGDFLVAAGRAGQAIPYLEKALAAPQQDTVENQGRRQEIEDSLQKARGHMKH